MTTPYNKITDVFHSKFQSKVEILPELEEQFFLNALGEFELDLYPLTYDETNQVISEDLSRSEINVLGTLMYKEYLSREHDRILKLNNIVGRDIKLTGLGDSKSNSFKTLQEVTVKITKMIDKLKDNNFEN